MHNIPGIFVDKDQEVEESSLDLDLHYVRLSALIRSFCMFGVG